MYKGCKINPRQLISVQEAFALDEKIILDHLEPWVQDLPRLVARVDVPRVLGGLRERRTMEKEDSLGRGPELVVHVGTMGARAQVAYPRRALLRYLERAGVEALKVNPR